MKNRHAIMLCITALFATGCGGSLVPIPAPLPVVVTLPVNPLVASFVNMDGQWVLADETGKRSCLVIQEGRVSIFDRTCSPDGRGFVPRILMAPKIASAGDTITLTLTYNPESFSEVRMRTTFVGEVQIDGQFQGYRTDERLDQPDTQSSEPVFATLSRQ
ncbi:MAG: hypothetical protein HBSAPP02_07520 [Phycisphaerae bacterium]|nr:MAG: hypothetical protein HBSAPP02_07520 [Phycisphaerae bacterium]